MMLMFFVAPNENERMTTPLSSGMKGLSMITHVNLVAYIVI